MLVERPIHPGLDHRTPEPVPARIRSRGLRCIPLHPTLAIVAECTVKLHIRHRVIHLRGHPQTHIPILHHVGRRAEVHRLHPNHAADQVVHIGDHAVDVLRHRPVRVGHTRRAAVVARADRGLRVGVLDLFRILVQNTLIISCGVQVVLIDRYGLPQAVVGELDAVDIGSS